MRCANSIPKHMLASLLGNQVIQNITVIGHYLVEGPIAPSLTPVLDETRLLQLRGQTRKRQRIARVAEGPRSIGGLNLSKLPPGC
jgi:hypothetical protein